MPSSSTSAARRPMSVLVNRFPRESSVAVEIGGVRTNLRMPGDLCLQRPAAGKGAGRPGQRDGRRG